MGYKDLVSNKVAAAIARATATNTQTTGITLPNKTLGSEQKSVNWRSSPFSVVGPPQSKLPPLPLFIVKGTSVSPLPDPHFYLSYFVFCEIVLLYHLFSYFSFVLSCFYFQTFSCPLLGIFSYNYITFLKIFLYFGCGGSCMSSDSKQEQTRNDRKKDRAPSACHRIRGNHFQRNSI